MDGIEQTCDPIVLEVIRTRVTSIVDEAAKIIVRTSFSMLLNEANDYSCVLTDSRGLLLAQNTASLPSFIGTCGVELYPPFGDRITLTRSLAGGRLLTRARYWAMFTRRTAKVC